MFRCFDPEDPVTGKLPVLGCPPDTLRASDGYLSDNLLTSASGGVTLSYDPLGRLYQVSSASGTTRFAYDGLNPVAEYDGSNVLQKRYVFGKDPDEPVAVYSGSSLGVAGRLYPQLDERGSVIALFNADGTPNTINRYDEYGTPAATNAGRFQYTGQMWIGEVGQYHYKSRAYAQQLGRFNQTDTIGYAGGVNLYAYVLNDPVNLTDPLGLDEGMTRVEDIIVQGTRYQPDPLPNNGADLVGLISFTGPGDFKLRPKTKEIVVRGKRRDKDRIPRCELDWLRSKLGAFGLPTSSLSQVRFQRGLGLSANPVTVAAYLMPGTRAVTQGNTVFVAPASWDLVTTRGNAIRYEEIFHTTQFAVAGAAALYGVYLGSSIVAWRYGLDPYSDNLIEYPAQKTADALADMYKNERPCG